MMTLIFETFFRSVTLGSTDLHGSIEGSWNLKPSKSYNRMSCPLPLGIDR